MLFLATYRWRDGEQEYYTRQFIKTADCLEKANMIAESYLTDMWGDETINEDGDYQPPCGFPIVRLDMVQGIRTLEDAVNAVGYVERYGGIIVPTN